MNKVEKALRTAALNICGALLVPFRLTGAAVGWCRKQHMKRTDTKRKLAAIEWAEKLAEKTGYRYIVLNIGGHYVVKPKRVWQKLLKCKGKYFVKGTSIQDLENRAVFITKYQINVYNH